jgi:hypothetical protein
MKNSVKRESACRQICQPKSSFDLRAVMDDGKIFVANLSRGKLGEAASALLGALLVTKFELAALSRADVLLQERRDSYFYVDGFPTLATPSFAGIMAESRKYALAIIVAKYLHILSTAALAEPIPTHGCHPPVSPPGV